MKIVISIGGSILISNLKPKRLQSYAESIEKLADEHNIYIVVGGGSIARDYILAARAMGANEAELDYLGIDVSCINARLFITALGSTAYPEPPHSYLEARCAALSGKIVVMGGLIPGQTTDAVSAVLAEYEGADLLINATSTDGVYDSDPNVNEDARKLITLSPSQLIDIVMNVNMTAGSKSPIDPLAAKIIQRSQIKTIVIDGRDPDNIIKAAKGLKIGTLIE